MGKLIQKLNQTDVLYSVKNISDYEHLDFIWGTNANREVYDVIIADIKEQELL